MFDAAISGIPSGGAYALIGVTVVLLYRMTGTLNFAAAVTGAFGAFTVVAINGAGVGLGVAVLVGMIVGGIVSGLLGVVAAFLFSDHDEISRSVVTIAMAIGLFAVAFRIFGDQPRAFPPLFGGSNITVGGVVLPTSNLVSAALALGLAVGINAVLTRTRLGLKYQALSVRAATAEGLGVPVRGLLVGAWAFSGFVAAFALTLAAPTRQADMTSLGLLVIPAFAAALIGGFRSFTWIAVGGITLGVFEALVIRVRPLATYRSALPFVVIVALLLWTQRRAIWDEAR
ncbi:MAG: branched-chain amino acid ABC transporter permease [Actinobacteria bacterium]|nr:branched-chain amino acid ABC transporter permease [Actinomycetota bacterium]